MASCSRIRSSPCSSSASHVALLPSSPWLRIASRPTVQQHLSKAAVVGVLATEARISSHQQLHKLGRRQPQGQQQQRTPLPLARSGDGASSGSPPPLTEGCRIKVVKPVTVFHVPKQPQGVQLEGMEGTFVKDVSLYKDQVLSANLQYKVEFSIPSAEPGAKPSKVLVHLGEDELQLA